MLPVVVCVGSSCYVRGAETVAESLERLIRQERLDVSIQVIGAFCMEQCSMGVSVRVGGQVFQGLTPADTERFFYSEVLPRAARTTGAYANMSISEDR